MSKAEDILARSVERLDTITKGVEPSEVYFIGDTAAHTMSGYYAMYAIEDATFTLLTLPLASGSTALATLQGKTLLKGHIWYVKPTAITLAGGSVLLYKL